MPLRQFSCGCQTVVVPRLGSKRGQGLRAACVRSAVGKRFTRQPAKRGFLYFFGHIRTRSGAWFPMQASSGTRWVPSPRQRQRGRRHSLIAPKPVAFDAWQPAPDRARGRRSCQNDVPARFSAAFFRLRGPSRPCRPQSPAADIAADGSDFGLKPAFRAPEIECV